MSKNQTELPFTEIVERASELIRVREDVEKKVRGVINDIYCRDIVKKEDWSFLIATSAITFTEQYITGNATINTGGTTITFSSDVTIDSAMVGRKIKITGNDYVYDIQSMSGTTGVVINPPLSGTQNISAQSYSIFRPYYPLAGNFDRFPKDGGLHVFFGGEKKNITPKDYQYYVANYLSTPSDVPDFCRLVGTVDTAGSQILEIVPPPKSAIAAEYDYLKTLAPLRETTSGLIGNISASGTSVRGDSNTQFGEATTGDYFRIDAFGTGNDSEWYRIIAITGNSGLTLATAFGVSGATSASYTICSSPKMPIMMHPGILYGAISVLAADQNDAMAGLYKQEYANILTDGKRIFKSRVYSQEVNLVASDYMYRR